MNKIDDLNQKFLNFQISLIANYRHSSSISTNEFENESLNSDTQHFQIDNLFSHIVFFIRYEGETILGFHLFDRDHKNNLFCPVGIDKSMIIGTLDNFYVSSTGLHLYFNEYSEVERTNVFNSFNVENMDISYPFIQKGLDGKDFIWSDDFWQEMAVGNADKINNEESDLRKICVEFLKKDGAQNKVVYDPACSTGKFIYELSQSIPDLQVYGSDCNIHMVKLAKELLPNVFHGHAGDIDLPQKVDYLIIRFLNMQVVSISDLYKIFEQLTALLNSSSKIIIFGRSPVLINCNFLIKAFNLKQVIKNARSPDNLKLFQFYVFEK